MGPDDAESKRRASKAKIDGFGGKVIHFLHNPLVELLIVFLVLVDVAIVSVETGIDFGWVCISGETFPETALNRTVSDSHHGDSHHGDSHHGDSHHVRRLAVGEAGEVPWTAVGEGEELLDDEPVLSAQEASDDGHGTILVCLGTHSPRVVSIERVLHTSSIIILGLFVIENFVKLYFIPGYFDCDSHGAWHIIDFSVVMISFLIEAVVRVLLHSWNQLDGRGGSGSGFDLIATILIFIRLWRVVRIAMGIREAVHESEEAIEALEKKVAKQYNKFMHPDDHSKHDKSVEMTKADEAAKKVEEGEMKAPAKDEEPAKEKEGDEPKAGKDEE